MYIVIFSSIIAFVLTFLESKSLLKNGMKVGFLIVTTLGCVHYNYGNDYMGYYAIYKEIESFPFNLNNILDGDFNSDVGWVFLNYAFKPIGGFFMLVAVLNIIQNYFVYIFIKNNVEKKWWPISIFIYLFSTSFYLLNFSMMRQGFVVCVFLSLWPLIFKRKFLPVLIIIYLLSFVHSSALILLPFAFWGFLPIANGKFWAIIYAILLICLWISGDFLNSIFKKFISISEFQNYVNTYGDQVFTDTIGIGFIMNLIPFFVAEYFLLKDTKSSVANRQLVALATVGFLVAPFGQIIPLIGRIGMYFQIYSIASIPLTYSSVKNRIIRISILSILIVMYSYSYINFFTNSIFSKSYSTFDTIFSQI